MKKYFFILSIIFCSCAVRHKNIEPSLALFPKIDTTQNVTVQFSQSNIMLESGNKKINRKATRKKLRIVPVFIDNQSNDTIIISKNTIELFSNFEPVEILQTSLYLSKLKQHPACYIPEALFGAFVSAGILFRYSANIQVQPSSFLLASLLPLSFYDFIVAKTANKKMRINILANDVCNKVIMPHSQTYGIICVKTASVEPLLYRFKKK